MAMDRLSELARDVRRAADEVVKRVELMHDAAPKDVIGKTDHLLDIRDGFDAVSEAADLAREHAHDCLRAVG